MDKTEEQVARDKAAVEAMKNAKSNMDTALKRIEHLERALSGAISALRQAKSDISPQVYCYQMDNQRNRTVHDRIEAQIVEAGKVL